MTRCRSSAGYAMLVMLLIMVLAATFALVAIAAVLAQQSVEGADAAGWRATAAEGQAVAAVTGFLRWRPAETTGADAGGDPEAISWQVSWAPVPVATGSGWPAVVVRALASAGRARRADDFVMELRHEPWAMGVTCSEDAEVRAPTTVTGSGIYVGGCLRGRENVFFAAGAGPLDPAGTPADLVRGDEFPAAAVRGGAGIFARGAETHAAVPATGEFLGDSDRHLGVPVRSSWLAGPSAEFLLAAAAEGAAPGPAFEAGVLTLDELPPATGAESICGRCLLLGRGEEVIIEGSPSPDVGRVLLVIDGDATLGASGRPVTISGGVVVTGRLTVSGPVAIDGSLHAGSLTVDAPMSVVVAPAGRSAPLSGAVLPTLVKSGR